MVELTLVLYTLIGALVCLPLIFNITDWGIREMRVKDIIAFTLLLPGTLLSMTIASVFITINTIQETNAMYKIKKVLNKKIFK